KGWKPLSAELPLMLHGNLFKTACPCVCTVLCAKHNGRNLCASFVVKTSKNVEWNFAAVLVYVCQLQSFPDAIETDELSDSVATLKPCLTMKHYQREVFIGHVLNFMACD